MKAITFTYTKPNDSVSDRVLLVLTQPTELVSGIDITELFEENANESLKFITRAQELQEEYLKNMRTLQKEYDLTHNFRSFSKDRMTEIVEL